MPVDLLEQRRREGKLYVWPGVRAADGGRTMYMFDGPRIEIQREVTTADSQQHTSERSVGTEVLCNYAGEGKWWPGVIAKVYEDGRTDIHYDDGGREKGVAAEMVRGRGWREAPNEKDLAAAAEAQYHIEAKGLHAVFYSFLRRKLALFSLGGVYLPPKKYVPPLNWPKLRFTFC